MLEQKEKKDKEIDQANNTNYEFGHYRGRYINYKQDEWKTVHS